MHMMSPTKTNITGTNNHLSLISFNINGLNSPIKRHKQTVFILKWSPVFCCIQETHHNNKERHYLKLKDWKSDFQSKWD
jgi:exonuclease III